MLRSLLGLVCLLTAVPAMGARAQSPPSISPRQQIFAMAAQRSGVPLAVLIGVAWEQSFLSDHSGRPSVGDEYGFMGLSPRPDHDTLDAAARLLRVPPDRLLRSDALNVLGGALLLAQDERALRARSRFRAPGGSQRSTSIVHVPLPSSVGDWAGAVVRFTGMRTEFAAHLMVDELYGALRQGIRANGIAMAAQPDARPDVLWMSSFHPLIDKAGETSGPADYPGAVWEPANYNNYGDARRPATFPIRYIVIHDSEGTCPNAVNWFQNAAAQASAHYMVCHDGRVIQFVHERDVAWHAGNLPINEESIGIEHEGYVAENTYTTAQYTASAALVSYLCEKYGIPPNRNVIFGHENVPDATHIDPGPFWNWRFYMSLIRGDGQSYDTGMTRVVTTLGNAIIRSCPDASCAVLGTANWGEEFYLVGKGSAWDRIDYDGHNAWVSVLSVDSGSGYELGFTRDTHVLAAPAPKAPVIGAIPAGQAYVSLTRDNGYWYIEFNHRYGFVPTAATAVLNCQNVDPAEPSTITPDCTIMLDLWTASLDPGSLLTP